MRSIPLVEIDELREGRIPCSLRENRGEFRKVRELWWRDFGPPDKMREGAPVHPLCPERRERAVEAENIVVCHALDLPGCQKRDRPCQALPYILRSARTCQKTRRDIEDKFSLPFDAKNLLTYYLLMQKIY